MRASPVLVPVVPALLVALVAAAGCTEEDKRTPACKQLLVCFLNEKTVVELAGIEERRYENFAAGAAEMEAAYGKNGTCYDGTDPAACEERCLCALRELCNDESARELTCAGTTAPDAERCCGLAELYEFEAGLEDSESPGDEDTPDGLDDTCEIPIGTVLPERDQLCVSNEG